MRTAEFWELVERARDGADGPADDVAGRLVQELAGLGQAQIDGFHQHLQRVLTASYQVDLWGAAYLVNGGCSDDGFEHFRGWLVTRGRAAFAGAVADPDSLAGLPAIRRAAATGEELACEPMLTVAGRAHLLATGEQWPGAGKPPDYPQLGAFWDFDDEAEVRRRFPRLAQLFVEPPEE